MSVSTTTRTVNRCCTALPVETKLTNINFLFFYCVSFTEVKITDKQHEKKFNFHAKKPKTLRKPTRTPLYEYVQTSECDRFGCRLCTDKQTNTNPSSFYFYK